MSSKKDKTKGGSSAGISNNPFPPLNPPAQGQAFPATGFAQFGQGQAQPAAPAQGMNQFSASLNMNNNSFLNNTAQQQQRGGAFMQPMQPLQATNQDVFKGNLMYHHGMNPATLKLVKEKQFQQLQDDPAVNAYEAKLKALIKDTYTNVYSLYLDQSQNTSTSRVGTADKNKPKASFPYLYDVISEREIEDKINQLKNDVKNFKIRYKSLYTKTKILSDEAEKENRRIRRHKDISAVLYGRRKQFLTDNSSYGYTMVRNRPGNRDHLDDQINHFYDDVMQDLDTRLKKCINEVVRLNDQISNTNRYIDNVSGISITQNTQSSIGPSQIKNLLRQQQQLFQIIGNEIAVNNSSLDVCKDKFLSHNTYKKYQDIFNKQRKSDWDLVEEKKINNGSQASTATGSQGAITNGGLAAVSTTAGTAAPMPALPNQFGSIAPSPFGGLGAVSSGAPPASSNLFGGMGNFGTGLGGAPQQAPSPFGGTAGGGAFGAFGGAPQQAASPFGGGGVSINPAQNQQTPGLGAPQQAASPFGGGGGGFAGFAAPQQAANPNPFGAPQQAANPSPFGAPQQAANPNPFGAPQQAANPFGAFGAPQQAANPFGAVNTNAAQPLAYGRSREAPM